MDLYTPYSKYLEQTFGEKTRKVTVNAGLSCPTRDGTISYGGCAFCDESGSASFHSAQAGAQSIQEQLRARIPALRERFGVNSFLAYFQSYTNTWAPPETLQTLFTAALAEPGIRGLCIGTRPDALPDPVLKLLEELAQKTTLTLELGIQSFEDPVLSWLERGHDEACARKSLERIRLLAPSVHVSVHLIFGCPMETPGAPARAAKLLNEYGIKGSKLHQLMILKGTRLADYWQNKPFPLLTLDEYIDRVTEFLAELNPAIYIERLYAIASVLERCLAPEWSRRRWWTHNHLQAELQRRGIKQGQRLL